MKVKIIDGTAEIICTCGSWIEHWRKFSKFGFLSDSCSVKGCDAPHKVGGHVHIAGSSDKHRYIIPLCTLHNESFGHVFDIENIIEMVSADISNYCGYTPPLTF